MDEIGNLTQFLAATYILSVYDFNTNDFCGSRSLNASSCVDRACYTNYSTEEFLSACNHSNMVKVVIHATNAFGNGSESEPIQISIGKFMIMASFANLRYIIMITVASNKVMMTTTNSDGKSVWL